MRVLVLCDGGGSIGVGHVMRSLALAEEAVAAGHEVVVAGHFQGSFLADQLAAASVEVAPLIAPVVGFDRQDFIDLVGRRRPDVLHVDSYEASGALTELLAAQGLEAVVSNMEDGAFGRRPAEVVVDPTFGAELSPRPDDGSTWLLRGSRYTPLRRRVMAARRRIDEVTAGTARADQALGEADLGEVDTTVDGLGKVVGDVARTVLVVMGGTDPVGLAPAVVGLLARTGLALEVTVIAVGKNASRARTAAHGSRLSLKILAPVDDLPAMMTGQDLVVSAAGTSVWELCCIGVPMAVVWAVDNQREGYDRAVEAGAALGLGGPELGGTGLGGSGAGASNLGEPALGGYERAVGLLRTSLTDARVRADLVLAGRRVVDGLGAWRVVRMWEQATRLGRSVPSGSSEQGSSRDHKTSRQLTARRARMDDARLLWQWRNDPGARASSRNTDMVPWPQHQAWLESSLAREDRVLLVAEDVAGPVGTVRWDRVGPGEWEVSITVAPERRGQSLARPILRAAEAALAEMSGSEVARSEVARSEVAGVSGARVTAYLAVVHVDNPRSARLFETSAYVPDSPPDRSGFMRFRKVAPVA